MRNYCLASAAAGGAIWSMGAVWIGPNLLRAEWAVALVLLAPLVLVPLGLRLAAGDPQTRQCWTWRAAVGLQLPAALMLAAAFALPPGSLAAAVALPWLAVTGLVALAGLNRLRARGLWPIDELCLDAGLIYLAVGGGWAVLSRFGARPLEFDPEIVLLTAIHFHHAGFVLPLLTAWAGREVGGPVGSLAAGLVTVSPPLVAVGITASQLQFNPALESLAAVLMALAGMLSAVLHARLALQSRWFWAVRALWGIAALSLAAAMVLAVLYALRFYGVTPGLDIPWMRALHGAPNALGFGLAGMAAWTLARGRDAAS